MGAGPQSAPRRAPGTARTRCRSRGHRRRVAGVNAAALPLLVEPAQLHERLARDQALRVVDLCKSEDYPGQHVPGAVHIPYAAIVRQAKPVGGLLPHPDEFARVLGDAGIGNEHHVVAYDDEGGGRAARLLWTLHAFGHRAASVLNGGRQAWAGAGLPLVAEPVALPRVQFACGRDPSVVAEYEDILARLGTPGVVLMDARSPEEFAGSKRLAEQAGRIPGAIHLEWTDLMDRSRDLRLKPPEALRAMLAERGVAATDEVICYCQTHHRSALNYLALVSLGFQRVRGYPGSWSDWGNRPSAPVETG